MSADILKFGKARKAAKRAADQKQAAANRAKFGQTRQDRRRDEANAARRDQSLDGARLTKRLDGSTPEDGTA